MIDIATIPQIDIAMMFSIGAPTISSAPHPKPMKKPISKIKFDAVYE